MDKLALNKIKEKGFDSKAQVRLLLLRAREYPERYKWVYKALKDHGLPELEGPIKTYWEEPYNVSPTTPSYKYVYPKHYKKARIDRLIKICKQCSDLGLNKAAEIINSKILTRIDQDVDLAKKIANQFWTIAKDMSTKDRQIFAEKLFTKLENFQPYNNLNSSTQTAVRQEISAKLKDK